MAQAAWLGAGLTIQTANGRAATAERPANDAGTQQMGEGGIVVAWFKHDIPAWMDGTEALDAEPYRAYHVICQLIYLNEGPIALNEHGIAGRCKQSIRTFRASLRTLLDIGKLTLSNGRLANSRAGKELDNVAENRVNAAKGGHKSAEARNSPHKPLENNTSDQATLQDDRSLKEKRREEETIEDSALASLALHADGHTRSEPPLKIKAPPRVVVDSNEDAVDRPSKLAKRGTRVPPDFAIDDDDRRFAAELGLSADVVEAETPQFIDYWSGIPGLRGLKLDWKGTWRNRMRDLKKRQPTSRGPPAGRPLTEFQRGRQELKGILNDLHDFSERSDQSSREDPRLLSRDPGERSEGIRGGVGGDIIDLPTSSHRSRS